MHYLLIDSTAIKNNPSFGFCNTKMAIAFDTKELREKFYNDRKDWDLSSKRITRKEAMKMLVTVDCNTNDKGLPLNQKWKHEDTVVLRKCKY